MAKWDIGDLLTVSVEFRNTAGVLASPTSVVLTVRAPNGTNQTPAVTNDGVGLYHASVSPDADGVWVYRFAGSGALVAAEEGEFYVRQRRVT